MSVPLILTLLAGAATCIGAFLGVIGQKPSNRVLAFSLGFAAGIMLLISLMIICITPRMMADLQLRASVAVTYRLFDMAAPFLRRVRRRMYEKWLVPRPGRRALPPPAASTCIPVCRCLHKQAGARSDHLAAPPCPSLRTGSQSFSRSASSSTVWRTWTGAPSWSMPPRICMTQPGQSMATTGAPVSLMFFSLRWRIGADTSGSLSE